MKCSMTSARRRDGFTLLELLVVVAIIAVLAAMLFPAVQRLREMANRTRCINNLHQIGVALNSHFGTHQCFPMNGGTVGVVRYNLATAPGSPANYMWGMGDPSLGPKTQPGPWPFAILPYIEETNAFTGQAYQAVVPLYGCPSRARTNPQDVPDYDGAFYYTHQDMQANMPLNPWAKIDYAGNYLMMPNLGTNDLRFYRDPDPVTGSRIPLGGARTYPITPSEIKDGSANTIIVGEKAMDPSAYNTGSWYWDDPYFAGGSGGTTRGAPPGRPTTPPNTNFHTPFYSDTPAYSQPFFSQPAFPAGLPFNYPSGLWVDSVGGSFANNWGSAHPGGVNFLFADGSVRTFNYNVDPGLFQGLLTPAGSDATPPES